MPQEQSRLTIRARITCPHCWNEFAQEESLWISEHPDLIGDTRLGPEYAIQFLPSRFTAEGLSTPKGSELRDWPVLLAT
ncbi:MAG: hypothetical protein ACK5OC_17910 [Pirellula sp.]|jgi:hypothetical protein